MSIAQKLYEEGFITYHRTDSVTVGSAAVFALRGYAEKEFGKNYVPEKPRFYKTKQKLAQEAHEAIRPTNVNLEQSSISGVLGHDAVKLYDLIFKRAVGSQMADAVTQSTSIFVLAKNAQSYRLKANGSVLKFPGFLKLNPQALNDNLLPDFKVGESLKSEKVDKIEHETPPPPRYNDASLIATCIANCDFGGKRNRASLNIRDNYRNYRRAPVRGERRRKICAHECWYCGQ